MSVEQISKATQNHIEQILLQKAIELINDPARAPYIKTSKVARQTNYRSQELGHVCSELEWLERYGGNSETVYKITDKILEHPDVESE